MWRFYFFSHDTICSLKQQLEGFYEELEKISYSINCFIGCNSSIDYNSNWNIGVENSLEIYHVNCVHPESLGILQIKDESKFINYNSKTCEKILNEKKIIQNYKKVEQFFRG